MRTNLLLLGASLLFVALLVVLIESALRITGLGAPDASRDSRLRYQEIYLPVLEPGERADGTAVWRTADPRLPYQSITRAGSERGLRIFTFGGSATAGLGFSPNVTFARYLEKMLTRVYPDRNVEVMNLGIVALASKQVKVLVDDAISRYEPDLVIVYSGNNELLEIHAEKFAEARSPWLSRVGAFASGFHLTRLVNRAIRGEPGTPSLADHDFGDEELRVTQHEIIQEIGMSPEEIHQVVDDYERNLREIYKAAKQAEVPLILMTVAANWEWRSRDDLPDDWIDRLIGIPGVVGTRRLARALEVLDQKVAQSKLEERSDWLYRRGLVERELGDLASARADLRAAMNEDPHMRRSTDPMCDRVRDVALAEGATLVDTVQVLAASADDGIVGFDEFYDYVHFTPRGALLVAARLFRTIQALGLVPPAHESAPNDFVESELARLAELREDPFDLDMWLGIGFDLAHISDRDLWKYDRMVDALDRHIGDDPNNLRALVYRGNAHYFRLHGARDAERDWHAALAPAREAGRGREVERNLERLRAEARAQ